MIKVIKVLGMSTLTLAFGAASMQQADYSFADYFKVLDSPFEFVAWTPIALLLIALLSGWTTLKSVVNPSASVEDARRIEEQIEKSETNIIKAIDQNKIYQLANKTSSESNEPIQVLSTNIEALKLGKYTEVTKINAPFFDEPTMHKKGIWGRLWGFGYREYSRVFINSNQIIIYEYALYGGFDVFKIPLKEILQVGVSSNLYVNITCKNEQVFSFITNRPEFFEQAISQVISSINEPLIP